MQHANLDEEINFPTGLPGGEESFYQDGLAEGANEGRRSGKASTIDFGLTPLEKQIIALTVAGYSSEEGANQIGLSVSAFRRHLIVIFDKLGVMNQFDLILFALYHQLIDRDEVSLPGDSRSLLPTAEVGCQPGVNKQVLFKCLQGKVTA